MFYRIMEQLIRDDSLDLTIQWLSITILGGGRLFRAALEKKAIIFLTRFLSCGATY